MSSQGIKLKTIYVNGLNLADYPGAGFCTGQTTIWMRRRNDASIELVYKLAAENQFVVVPSMPGVTVVTNGSNGSHKFQITLSDGEVTKHVTRVGHLQDQASIREILRPYLQLTGRLRIEAASVGRQIEQGYTHVNKLMPINNVTVYGLNVPFASERRTYVIDGIEFAVVATESYQTRRISTAVQLPDRHSHVIIRPGHYYRDNPRLYLSTDPKTGLRMKPITEVSVAGNEINEFLQGSVANVGSPREVWTAIDRYYQHLRLNFRIRPNR